MKARAPTPPGTYYEFGTGWGGTLASFMLAAERLASEFKLSPADFRVFAFDSFEGLPASSHPADDHSGWKPGAFANDVEIIKQKMQSHPFASQVEANYIKGYFENTLTPELAEKIKATPPCIITIDVDFYTSTRNVLDWMDQFIASGALVYFDDYWAFHGHPDYGQIRAIREFCAGSKGNLVPFDTYGEAGKTFIYSRKEFEYRT